MYTIIFFYFFLYVVSTLVSFWWNLHLHLFVILCTCVILRVSLKHRLQRRAFECGPTLLHRYHGPALSVVFKC